MAKMTEAKAKELLEAREKLIENAGSVVNKDMFRPELNEEGELISLGKVDMNRASTYKEDIISGKVPDSGWKNLPLETLPSRGLFYPDGTVISIKQATVKEIRHFSTIDENDQIDGDDKINYVLESCCKIRMPNNPRATWKDIQDIDRFFIIFCIRESTFIEGQNKLTMNIACNVCGNVDLIELNKDNLSFFNIDERLMKYYDPEEKTFIIRTKEGDVFPIYLPTMGIGIFIKNYVITKRQNREYFDKTFIKMAPFLFKDWRSLNESIYKAKDEETFNYGHKKLSIFSGILDIFAKSISTDIQHTCSSCSSEVSAPLDFQGGIRSLFLYTDIFSELA